MRHGKKFNHLSRKAPHRKAMLANMACSLIEHKRIKTTVAKAKALRVYIEPLLTKSKEDTTHSRRTVFSYLKQKQAITELFGDVAAKIADRPGGYTRILKLSNRLGDNAEMCFIELVDYNEDYQTDKSKRKKTRRRGGTGKTQVQEVVETPVAEEEPKAEETTEEAPANEEVVEEKTKAEETTEEDPANEEVVEEKTKAEETTEEAPATEEVVEEETKAEETTEEAPENEENKPKEA